MNPLLEKAYYSCPIFIQNWAVSFLGRKLRKERFNQAGEKMLAELLKSENQSRDYINSLQNEMFVKIARHAIKTTAFYSNWAINNNIFENDIKSLADIKLFPVIEKKFIRENASSFRSNDDSLASSQFIISTSGTTGTPLTIYTDKYSRSAHYAFFSRLRMRYGITEQDKRVTLFGRMIMLADQKKPPFWRYDATNKNLLMSSYHLSDMNLMHYYNKLCDYKPQEVFAYPSSIYAIARYIVANQLPPIQLKLVMTTAENLLPHQRDIISQAFNAPIVNQYGCTEMAFFCSDYLDGTMKFHPEHGIVEIRNENNALSLTGSGDLIATGFINFSMPVIRYLVGDRIVLAEPDDAGRQQLSYVQGRVDDVIYTSNGTPIGRLDPIFKGGSGIQCAQIYQANNGTIELRLVPDSTYSSSHGETLKAELIKRVGTDIQIDIIICEKIEKEINGKIKPVISHYKQVPH
jgi:phenylacetate-CoA ligase